MKAKEKDLLGELFILLAIAFIISLPLLMASQLTVPLTYEVQK